MTQPLETVFAALGDRTRQGIVSALAHGPLTVNELVDRFELGQPAISKHLKVLEKAGIVRKEVQGNRRLCRLEGEALSAAGNWIELQRRHWAARLDKLEKYLNNVERRNNGT